VVGRLSGRPQGGADAGHAATGQRLDRSRHKRQTTSRPPRRLFVPANQEVSFCYNAICFGTISAKTVGTWEQTQEKCWKCRCSKR
jgi:hypothetical protein